MHASLLRMLLAVTVASLVGSTACDAGFFQGPTTALLLVVSAETEPSYADTNGYRVQVLGAESAELLAERFLSANGSTGFEFSSITFGTSLDVLVHLGDVDQHCAVGRQNPRAVRLALTRTEVEFRVTCS
jgi:hypothetical protein